MREKIGVELLFSRNQTEKPIHVPQTLRTTAGRRGQNLEDCSRFVYTAVTLVTRRADVAFADSRWPVHNEVLALVLGGGQGSRLFPLTQHSLEAGRADRRQIPPDRHPDQQLPARRHPADLRADAVQLGVAQPAHRRRPTGWTSSARASSRSSRPSRRRTTPDWFQGTADAVRQAARHFARYDADYYLILAGDHLYRMDYCELVDAHIDRQRRHHDRRAAGDARRRVGAWASSGSTATARSSAFEEKPDAARLAEIGQSIPAGASFAGHTPDKPFVASMGIYVFSREVLLRGARAGRGDGLRPGIIPQALEPLRRAARTCFAATGPTSEPSSRSTTPTSCSTQPGAPFSFYDPRRPIYTRAALSAGRPRSADCTVRDAIIAEGCDIDRCAIEQSVIGIRTNIRPGTRITRSCCSAPTSAVRR